MYFITNIKTKNCNSLKINVFLKIISNVQNSQTILYCTFALNQTV